MMSSKLPLPLSRRTFTSTSSASGATPMVPKALSAAAMVPATCVPWLNKSGSA